MTSSNDGQDLAVNAECGGSKERVARRSLGRRTRSDAGPRVVAATLREVSMTETDIEVATDQYRLGGGGEDLLLGMCQEGQEGAYRDRA